MTESRDWRKAVVQQQPGGAAEKVEQEVVEVQVVAVADRDPGVLQGFGLPVLEAMACGTAVITSRGTSMAEFAGDFVRLIDPLDIEELSFSLQTLLEDDTERAELAQKVTKHAAGFTWERCAEQHLELYRCAMESWQQAKR